MEVKSEMAAGSKFLPLSPRRRVVAKIIHITGLVVAMAGLWQIVRFVSGDVYLPLLDHYMPRAALKPGFEWVHSFKHGLVGSMLIFVATMAASFSLICIARVIEIGSNQYRVEQRELNAASRLKAERQRRRDAFAIARARRQNKGWGTTSVVAAFVIGWLLF